MKYYRHLYIGQSIKQTEMIRMRIRMNRIPLLYYIITLAQNEDQLEIMSAAMLKQPYYRKKQLCIVGVASNYEESLELVQQILQDTIRETESTDMKSYLKAGMDG